MIECEFVGKDLLVERYSGKISLPDIFELKNFEFEHELFRNVSKVLVILKDSQFEVVPLSDMVTDYLACMKGVVGTRKIAVLVSLPMQVAQCELMMKSLDQLGIRPNVKIFLSKKEACEWLEIPESIVSEE